jgi:D,D-heptose 1,7-bisphosphate phosphatase
MIDLPRPTINAPEQAAILVGGIGSRLHPLTTETPKPLLEIDGRSFIDCLLEACIRFGFRDLVLLAGFGAEQFARYVRSKRNFLPLGVTLDLVVEPEPRGTAGAVRHATGRLADRFMLLNGDSFFDVNWLDLLTIAPDNSESLVTALCRSDDTSRFGVVKLEDDLVTEFSARGSGPGLINAGMYVLDRRTVQHFPERGSLEETVLPMLAAKGLVRGRAYEGFFIDIGMPDSLQEARSALPSRRCKPAVFFDRDDTLVIDSGYIHRPEDLKFCHGAVAAIKHLNDIGYYVFLVTNQSGVARGIYSELDVRAFNTELQRRLRRSGAHIDDIRYCPYHPEGEIEEYRRSSDWRKPGPGMLQDLLNSWPVRRELSFVVGDKGTDISAAEAAGLQGLLYRGGDLSILVSQHIAAAPALAGIRKSGAY